MLSNCHSGMEGCPVFGEHAQFVGILVRPLRHKNDGAEIQVDCCAYSIFFLNII